MENSRGPDMVTVFMCDKNSVNRGILEPNRGHQFKNALAAWSAVNEYAMATISDPGAIALGAGREHSQLEWVGLEGKHRGRRVGRKGRGLLERRWGVGVELSVEEFKSCNL